METTNYLNDDAKNIKTNNCITNKKESLSNSKFLKENFDKLMKYERLRFVTFILCGHQWPKMEIVSPLKLAKAGFYYVENDKVRCVFCQGSLSNWDKNDNEPMEEHRKHFPSCPFVQGKFCGNVPLESDPEINAALKQNGTDSEMKSPKNEVKYNKSLKPKFPQFKTIDSRRETFNSKKWILRRDKMAFVNAGLYYLGKDDYTRCFQCGGVFYNWKPYERPMEEHALYFPECAFVLAERGEKFLEFVKFKAKIIEMRLKLEENYDLNANALDSMRKLTFDDYLVLKEASSNMLMKLLPESTSNSNSSNNSSQRKEDAFGNLNFNLLMDDNRPYKNFIKYAQEFFFLIDCQRMFQELNIRKSIDYESEDTGFSSSTSCSSSGSSINEKLIFSLPIGNANCGSSRSSFGSSSGSDSDYSGFNSDSEDVNYSSGASSGNSSPLPNDGNNTAILNSKSTGSHSKGKFPEQNLPKSNLTCLICYENQVQVVFLPCGHQLSCIQCANNLHKCPVCRSDISGKVRTYFAYVEQNN